MLFRGQYNCDDNKEKGRDHIFSADKRVIVFDVEGVLVVPGGDAKIYRNGNGGYKLNKESSYVIGRALSGEHFDEVVFWSTSCPVLGISDFYFFDAHRALQEHFPFSIVHQRIGGAKNDGQKIIKDLRVISPSLSNVVAIEDDDFFQQQERVVRYCSKQNLRIAYFNAVDKIGRSGRKAI